MAAGLSAERAARNEAVFRDANERVEQRLRELSLIDGRSPFLCECDDASCTDALRLTHDEYEAVRGHPRHFLVATSHFGGGTKLVRRYDGFDVVEKTGVEGRVVTELDPRKPA